MNIVLIESIAQYADLFMKLAGLVEMIESLGLNEDVKQFILSLPDTEKQHYVAAVRKKPKISLQELQSIVKQPEEKESPYLPEEVEFVSWNIPLGMQEWSLINLRKERRGIKDRDSWPQEYLI